MRFVLVVGVIILAIAAVVIFVIPTSNQAMDPSDFEVTNPWCADEVKANLTQFTHTELMPGYFIGKIVTKPVGANESPRAYRGEAWILDNLWGQTRNYLVIIKYGNEIPCEAVITLMTKEIIAHGISYSWVKSDAQKTLKYQGAMTRTLLTDGLAALVMAEEVTEDFGLVEPLPRWDGASTPTCEHLQAIKWLRENGYISNQGNNSYLTLQGCE